MSDDRDGCFEYQFANYFEYVKPTAEFSLLTSSYNISRTWMLK